MLDCTGNVIGAKECITDTTPVASRPIGCKPIVTPGCPDTRILDCAGREIGVIECNLIMGQPVEPTPTSTPLETTATVPVVTETEPEETVAAAGCPTFTPPACRADQTVVQAPIPSEFQVAGCATTMPMCAAGPTDTDDTTPSARCGASQSLNSATGRCENTDAACQPFLRFCERGESPNQLCSCSPTKASELGPRACVPLTTCPDTRVLNCDATRQSSVRNCVVAVEETNPLELCLAEYRTKSIDPLLNTAPTVANASWYPDWYARCGSFFPNLGGDGNNTNANNYSGPDSGQGSPTGGSDGNGGGNGPGAPGSF